MKVVFLCVQNSARSQIAEGWGRHFAPAGSEVYSAGSSPAFVRLNAIAAMAEVGIDLTTHTSKGLDDVPLADADYVITLCADEVCPVVLGANHLHWPIADPAHQGIEAFRAARDEIRDRIRGLFDLDAEGLQ
ncbi:MAG: arsenate reductase ArsC [Proteobacteria bacterium]|nr:arsenate reductase ArsC [Pseudomonadota bacterium]